MPNCITEPARSARPPRNHSAYVERIDAPLILPGIPTGPDLYRVLDAGPDNYGPGQVLPGDLIVASPALDDRELIERFDRVAGDQLWMLFRHDDGRTSIARVVDVGDDEPIPLDGEPIATVIATVHTFTTSGLLPPSPSPLTGAEIVERATAMWRTWRSTHPAVDSLPPEEANGRMEAIEAADEAETRRIERELTPTDKGALLALAADPLVWDTPEQWGDVRIADSIRGVIQTLVNLPRGEA